MKVYLIIALALVAASPVDARRRKPNNVFPIQPEEDESRIVGGSNASDGQFPYQVEVDVAAYLCGGSIISNVCQAYR